jgi:hypothetical protein
LLLEDVALAVLQDFAVRVDGFRHLDDNFLRALLVCLRYVVCAPGEEIVVAGDVERSMYFIGQGRVLVKLGALEMLRDRGEFFGELSLLYGFSHLETCVGITVTELYRLDEGPYKRVLHRFPEYRSLNKLMWSTIATSFDCTAIANASQIAPPRSSFLYKSSSSTKRATLDGIGESNAEGFYFNSRIYRASMELLAKLHDMGSMESKAFVLKCRASAHTQASQRQVAVSDGVVALSVKSKSTD